MNKTKFKNKTTLTNAYLYTEKDPFDKEQYYLSLTYAVETNRDIREIHIPKVKLPIDDVYNIELIKDDYNGCMYAQYACKLILPGATLDVQEVEKEGLPPHAYTEKVIKKKYVEMTLSEIEKKLGLNIKVVAEKEIVE